MFSTRSARVCLYGLAAWLCVAMLAAVGQTGDDKKTDKKPQKKAQQVWTDPNDPSIPAEFKFQGEYATKEGKMIGCQVIALGNGTFQAVLCKGGLPGQGWDGKDKSLMDGKLEDDKVVFIPATGKRRYLAQAPTEFSATAKFPPAGQIDASGTISGDTFIVAIGGTENTVALKKIQRESPTLGKKPPEGAIVLFDGTNKDEWNGGRLDKKTGFLNTDGNDITTKRKFNSYTAHVEFLLPFRPEARGQGRGNSGFYQVDHYEVQILDSFGLEGKDNECGGVYTRLAPKVNMCLPPLSWQTYDVEFTSAVRDDSGKKIKNARITLKHNGVLVHDNAEIAGVTGGARNEPEGTPGVLRLQGHGNPLQFRNIWLVEKKPDNEAKEKRSVQTNSIYQFPATTIDGQKIELAKYKGKVVMIVNVASECGYTDQYQGLQSLYAKYAKDGLAILAFPCNDFGGQEPGDEAKIKTFCTKNYGVKFDLFSKITLSGKEASPLYRFLTSKETNPSHAGQVKWNFEKFIIGRDGAIVARFQSGTEPESEEVVGVIERELQKK